MNMNETRLAPEAGAATEGYRRTGTLNDYRVTGPVPEPSSSIGMAVGGLVIAAAIGVGAYMYYTSHRDASSGPSIASVNGGNGTERQPSSAPAAQPPASESVATAPSDSSTSQQ